jgi:transposase InsO family protein
MFDTCMLHLCIRVPDIKSRRRMRDLSYIRPRTPPLNAKAERSRGTDKTEFYQLVEYKDDIDIAKKLQEWEIFYNCHRPHSKLKGKTPFEVLKMKLAC